MDSDSWIHDCPFYPGLAWGRGRKPVDSSPLYLLALLCVLLESGSSVAGSYKAEIEGLARAGFSSEPQLVNDSAHVQVPAETGSSGSFRAFESHGSAPSWLLAAGWKWPLPCLSSLLHQSQQEVPNLCRLLLEATWPCPCHILFL